MKVQTYEKMNKEIKNILRIDNSPSSAYAAKRIEELEEENERLYGKLNMISDIIEEGRDM